MCHPYMFESLMLATFVINSFESLKSKWEIVEVFVEPAA